MGTSVQPAIFVLATRHGFQIAIPPLDHLIKNYQGGSNATHQSQTGG